MFNSIPEICILVCIILVGGFGLSDGKPSLAIPNSKFESETTIFPIPSSDTYDKTHHVKEQNCLESISTLCVGVESYPHDELKNIISSHYDNYFVNEIPILSGRKTDDDDLEMCDSVVEYIRPISGITAENISKLIINIGLNYTQEIRIEKCIQTNSTCNYVKDMGLYKSYCKQAYTYQRLLSVDTSFTKVSFDLFKIPSGCICASKQVY